MAMLPCSIVVLSEWSSTWTINALIGNVESTQNHMSDNATYPDLMQIGRGSIFDLSL